jgi:hypothetical protein
MIPSPQASAPPAATKATPIKNPVAATLLALFGFAALVFGAVGDLSDDQYYDAPQSTAYITMFSGALGLAIVVFSLTALFRITLAAGRSVLPYLVLPFITGAAIGAGLRVVTAHTADANIGAGFVVLLGPLLVLPMLVGAIVVSNRLLPSRTAAAGVKPSGVSTWPVRALVLGSVGLVSPVLTIVLSIFVGWLSLIVTLSAGNGSMLEGHSRTNHPSRIVLRRSRLRWWLSGHYLVHDVHDRLAFRLTGLASTSI